MESEIAVFDRLVSAGPPARPAVSLGTACVLGGSVAGLLAARVLADHARQVIVVERDAVNVTGASRPGVPQDQQVHTLLPGGLYWLDRWLPGFTQQARDGGAVLARPGQHMVYLQGEPQLTAGEHPMLTASRPFIESVIRARVLALPNVAAVQGQATSLEFRDGMVSGVRIGSGDVLGADFVVDAMGRASRLSDWLSAAGYDRPGLQRVHTGINYASALFRRDEYRQPGAQTVALGRFMPPYQADGVAVAAVNAIEDQRWIVMLMGYDDDKPGRTIGEFRAACLKLPPLFGEAAQGDVLTEDILTYHQGDSRRRNFAGLENFPAGLVSVGDAVASFNPIYGQGMSSAALHAACLSQYLMSDPDHNKQADGFFALENVVVDAAWSLSAGSDLARLDALSGASVPEDIAAQRWALDQLLRAVLVDETVSAAVNDVAFMVAHPGTLADPVLLERAVTANQRTMPG